VLELPDDALVLPDLNIVAVEMGPGLVQGTFITVRLVLEAVNNVPLVVDGTGAILSHGWDPERLTFRSMPHFPFSGLRVKIAEPAGTVGRLDCLRVG